MKYEIASRPTITISRAKGVVRLGNFFNNNYYYNEMTQFRGSWKDYLIPGESTNYWRWGAIWNEKVNGKRHLCTFSMALIQSRDFASQLGIGIFADAKCQCTQEIFTLELRSHSRQKENGFSRSAFVLYGLGIRSMMFQCSTRISNWDFERDEIFWQASWPKAKVNSEHNFQAASCICLKGNVGIR